MEVLFTFVSVISLCVCMLVRPTHVICPPGWYAEGVRPNGATTCLPAPSGPDVISTHGVEDRSVQPPGAIEARIYCTGGAHPIVVDARTVGCQR